MFSSESQYSIVIHAKNDEKSKFSRMKSFLRQKIANMMYAVREKASNISINGRRIVAQPDDIPTELKYVSVKQLSKIKKTLAVLSADVNGPGGKRPGICAPAPSPRSEFDDDDDGSDITVRYEDAKDAKGPIKATPKGKANTPTPSLYVENTQEAQEERINTEVKALEDKDLEKRHSPVEKQEVSTYIKRLMRKNRPQAAKGERSSTVIPSYIIIDEDSSVPITPRRRKRPAAAKGKRTVSSSADLFDLLVDVLLERFRDPTTDARPKRNIPQAPRGRVSRNLGITNELLMPCVEDNEMVASGIPIADDGATALNDTGGRVHVIQVAEVPGAGIGEASGNVFEKPPEEDTTSLDELLEDLGIHTTWNTKARTTVSRNKDAHVDAWITSDDDDDDDNGGGVYGVPYLPKSQRTGNGLQRRFKS